VIELATVRLTEGRSWLHAFPVGSYHHPEHGLLTFTPGRLERIAEGVNRGVRGVALALDYDHRTDPAKGGRAAGWIDWAEVRSDGLWLSVNFTSEALAEVRRGEWRYLSPEFAPSWADPRTGVVHTDVLLGAALTNRPFLTRPRAHRGQRAKHPGARDPAPDDRGPGFRRWQPRRDGHPRPDHRTATAPRGGDVLPHPGGNHQADGDRRPPPVLRGGGPPPRIGEL
jgi:Mu-like prophage I protein